MRTYAEVELYILLHANALLEYLPYVVNSTQRNSQADTRDTP